MGHRNEDVLADVIRTAFPERARAAAEHRSAAGA
jgi:hypothetical protein